MNLIDPSLIDKVNPGDENKNGAFSRPKARDKLKMKLENDTLPLSLLSEDKFNDTATFLEFYRA